MRLPQFYADEQEKVIVGQQQSSHIGIFRVPFKALSFSTASRSIDPKNIERLKRIFRTEGCLRLHKENFISATVSPQLARYLPNRQLRDGIPPLVSIEKLPENSVQCLFGQHRVRAASGYIQQQSDRWWCVELYVKKDSNDPLEQDRREEFQNAKNFSDGEIFRNIRLRAHSKDRAGESKWWARLSKGKARDLRQLLRSTKYRSAFDKLIPFRGLWPAIQLGALHRLLTLRCEEEVVNYLETMFATWSCIWGAESGEELDPVDVAALQLSWPFKSFSDQKRLAQLFEGGAICRSENEWRRRTLWAKISTFKSMVTSFQTLFDDLVYLEACAKALKPFFPAIEDGTTFRTNVESYFRPSDSIVKLQRRDGKFVEIPNASDCAFEFAYLQIWLFAMRNFPQMTGLTPKKERGQRKPVAQEPDELSLYKFAELARRLGFWSDAIIECLEHQAVLKLAIRIIRNNSATEVDESSAEFRSLSNRISELIQHIPNLPTTGPPGRIQRPEEALVRRCGRPYENSHYSDRDFLFLRDMKEHSINSTLVDSYLVKIQFFKNFWGDDQIFSFISTDAILENVLQENSPVSFSPTEDDPEGFNHSDSPEIFVDVDQPIPADTHTMVHHDAVSGGLVQSPAQITAQAAQPPDTTTSQIPAAQDTNVSKLAKRGVLFQIWEIFDEGVEIQKRQILTASLENEINDMIRKFYTAQSIDGQTIALRKPNQPLHRWLKMIGSGPICFYKEKASHGEAMEQWKKAVSEYVNKTNPGYTSSDRKRKGLN